LDGGDRASPRGVYPTFAYCICDLHYSEGFKVIRDDASAKSYVGIGNKEEKH
jgi:hypothetical protein